MKFSTLGLSTSIVLNIALLGIVVTGLSRGGDEAADQPVGAGVAAPAASPSGPGPETWTGLHAGDLAAQRDRLKAEGFPDRVIRAILGAEIRERYAAQRKALEGDADRPYWKAAKPDPAVNAQLRELSRAERKELRDLLGSDKDDSDVSRYQRLIPNLPAEKAEELAAITQRYNDQRMELFTGGTLTPADQQKLRALEKSAHDEFAAVLTPEELENYDLRASRTAMQLQYSLSAFDATEAEYRALYKLQSAFDEQYSPLYSGVSEDDMKARAEAQKQLRDQIAAALGPDRYAQYQRATDFNYRQATQLVARLQLPPETADNLYAVQKEYQQKRAEAFSAARNAPGGFDAMQQQLTTLQQEATARVSTLLNGNQSAVDAYKRYGGQWLRMYVPNVTRSPADAPR